MEFEDYYPQYEDTCDISDYDMYLDWLVKTDDIVSISDVMEDEDYNVKASVAMNRHITGEMLSELLEDKTVRYLIAIDTKAYPELLIRIAKDSDAAIREKVDNNLVFRHFIEGLNESLNEANYSISKRLEYFAGRGEFELHYDDNKHTVRRVTFDLENNLMNLFDTKDKNKIVGVFNLSTKKMVDLRKAQIKKITPKIR